MYLLFKRIFRFFLSIESILIINTTILFKIFLNKNSKIVLFYFPVRAYQENILELISELKKINNIEVILAYSVKGSLGIKNYKRAYFLNLGYLKYIFNIDIFFSNYVVYNFPSSRNKIYINHNIYDTPMIEEENEKNLIKTIKRFDYIFLSSDISILNFKKKIDKFTNKKNVTKKISLINTGYLKLDHVYKKLQRIKKKETSILLAPTLSSTYKNFNISKDLNQIIKNILYNTEFNLIYRPHPGDLINSKQIKIINEIEDEFYNNKKFHLDRDASYLNSYNKSKILITDFSGTAYTYAFAKLRPVIFISKNERELKKNNLNNLFYFQNRLLVGTVVEKINLLEKEIFKVNKRLPFFSNKIRSLRNKRIKYFNKSIYKNLFHIKKILELK